jgi:hypothetical protein
MFEGIEGHATKEKGLSGRTNVVVRHRHSSRSRWKSGPGASRLGHVAEVLALKTREGFFKLEVR